MIQALLIDDEINALKGLEIELRNFKDKVQIAGSYTSTANALEHLKHKDVDVVFLDIEMPEMNGFQFLEKFRERNFEVIFTTAYSKYAIDAIKNEAVDYLLKPVDIDDLESCIQRLEKKLYKNSFDLKFEEAIEKISGLNSNIRKIKLSYDGKVVFFEPSEILYCEGSGNYTNVFTNTGEKILLTKKLKQLQDELPEDLFYRVHNSYIVNISCVRAYLKNEGIVLLHNDVSIPVSKQKRSDIIDKI